MFLNTLTGIRTHNTFLAAEALLWYEINSLVVSPAALRHFKIVGLLLLLLLLLFYAYSTFSYQLNDHDLSYRGSLNECCKHFYLIKPQCYRIYEWKHHYVP